MGAGVFELVVGSADDTNIDPGDAVTFHRDHQRKYRDDYANCGRHPFVRADPQPAGERPLLERQWRRAGRLCPPKSLSVPRVRLGQYPTFSRTYNSANSAPTLANAIPGSRRLLPSEYGSTVPLTGVFTDA